MFWRLGENIDPSYLQMVILSHIVFACFYSLFNNVIEKVWTKKKPVIGKENIRQVLVGNLHINANLPINLSAKESDREAFVLRDYLTETLHIKGVKTTFNNLISINNCRILTFQFIVPNRHSLLRCLCRHVNSCRYVPQTNLYCEIAI